MVKALSFSDYKRELNSLLSDIKADLDYIKNNFHDHIDESKFHVLDNVLLMNMTLAKPYIKIFNIIELPDGNFLLECQLYIFKENYTSYRQDFVYCHVTQYAKVKLHNSVDGIHLKDFIKIS